MLNYLASKSPKRLTVVAALTVAVLLGCASDSARTPVAVRAEPSAPVSDGDQAAIEACQTYLSTRSSDIDAAGGSGSGGQLVAGYSTSLMAVRQWQGRKTAELSHGAQPGSSAVNPGDASAPSQAVSLCFADDAVEVRSGPGVDAEAPAANSTASRSVFLVFANGDTTGVAYGKASDLPAQRP